MTVKFVTDSTSYLPRDLRARYDISVVPLTVNLDGQVFDDDALDYSPFYRALESTKSFPTSSQPAVTYFVDAFSAAAAKGDSVVGVFISSEMSGTYSTALLARDMVRETYPDAVIEIVDSRSNCMELGFALMAGVELAEQGGEMSDIIHAIESRIARTRFIFVPDTLEYLRRGGRMGGAAALVGSLLQIRPILTVVDGKTDVFAKVRTKKRALDEIVAAFKRDIEEKGGLGGAIVHNIDDEIEGQRVVDMIRAACDVDIDVTPIGPVIGTHVGPGTVGLAYYTVEEMCK
ncbi:MAG: DegV family protein [Coriobacteriia bacterium]|nr:DegV family protein [Coriobacteriia bacterium]MBN2823591.1 DegV family protein [Coriobacteriia bacterium]